MSKRNKHGLNAANVVRIGLAAFHNARALKPADGADLVGLWMQELSRKMQGDDEVGCYYREVISRWEAEDNLRKLVAENAQVATSTALPDNRIIGGLENG